jgi:hypothetical protein
MKRTWLTPTSIIGLVALYIVMYIWQPGGVRLLIILTDVLSVAFAVLASTLALRASRMFEPGVPARRVWLLLGVGMSTWTAAELLWAYYRIVLDQAVPFPSVADILWALGYITVLVTLWLQYRALGVGLSPRLKLTVLAIYSVMLAIIFVFLLWPILAEPGQVPTIEILLSAYSLIGDVIMAFIATLSLLVLWKGVVGRPWQYIVISILLVVIADLAFSYATWNKMYATGSNLLSGVVDVVYLSAYVVAAAGGYRQITLSLPQVIGNEV